MSRILTRQQARELKQRTRPQIASGVKSIGNLLMFNLKAELNVDVAKRRVEAYASVFDVWDDWNDIMRRGAFERSIKERFAAHDPSRVKVLHAHKWDEACGLPVHMEEDSTGLLTVTEFDESDHAKGILLKVDAGVLDGLSVGFRIHGAAGSNWLEWEDIEDLADMVADGSLPPHDPWWMPPREILDTDLFEYSFVPFPAVDDARVTTAKAATMFFVPKSTLATYQREMSDKARLKYTEQLRELKDESSEASAQSDNISELRAEVADLRALILSTAASPAAVTVDSTAGDTTTLRAGRVLSQRNMERLEAASESVQGAAEHIQEVLAEAQSAAEDDSETDEAAAVSTSSTGDSESGAEEDTELTDEAVVRQVVNGLRAYLAELRSTSHVR